MVRKQYSRSNKARPKSPAPTDGWLLDELASLSGLPQTTIRYYVQQRLLRPIERRGTATRYPRRSLLLVLGLHRLSSEGKATLLERKRKLDTLGDQELKDWLGTERIPAAAAAALGIEPQPMQSLDAASPSPPLIDGTGAVVEHWQRIPLLPGLELMIRANAKEPVRLTAQRIWEVYSVR